MRVVFLSLLVAAAFAAPPAHSHPKFAQGYRLIAFSETNSTWMTDAEINELSYQAQFIDITDEIPMPLREVNEKSIPSAPRMQFEVNAVINENLCTDGDCAGEVWRLSTRLAEYNNRYYTQRSGQESVLWLEEQYRAAAGSRLGQDVTISIFEHSWLQPSLRVRVQGRVTPDEIAVIGGHIDSTGPGMPTGRAPGFDDDAAGSATVFAAFKALMDADWRPERTVEFQAYAAEEVGLRGSADVAQAMFNNGDNIVSMCQFDMTCYPGRQGQRLVGLTSDFTSSVLTTFIGQLIDEYTSDYMGHERSTCGYGCSDHASFTSRGYASAFPFEARFGSHNPLIHTTGDTAAQCDREYMGEFAKLAVAFTVELGSIL